MLSSSRLLFLVSGSMKTVTKMASTLTAPAIDSAAKRPPVLIRIGNKNTPMNGISYVFTEFGPNVTTFVYRTKLFPVEGRTTGHGVASAAGKLGAFIVTPRIWIVLPPIRSIMAAPTKCL